MIKHADLFICLLVLVSSCLLLILVAISCSLFHCSNMFRVKGEVAMDLIALQEDQG